MSGAIPNLGFLKREHRNLKTKTMKKPTPTKISVRLYFNQSGICIGGLALEVHSEKFNFSGDYYSSEDAMIYPSQDVQGKDWRTINKDRVKIWYEAVKANKN
jgi:hypothetical protein